MESSFSRFIFDIKDKEEVINWSKKLIEHKNEVIEILEKENVLIEDAYMEIINDEIHVYYYWIAQNINIASNLSKESKSEINIFHRNFISKYRKRLVKLDNLFKFINDKYK